MLPRHDKKTQLAFLKAYIRLNIHKDHDSYNFYTSFVQILEKLFLILSQGTDITHSILLSSKSDIIYNLKQLETLPKIILLNQNIDNQLVKILDTNFREQICNLCKALDIDFIKYITMFFLPPVSGTVDNSVDWGRDIEFLLKHQMDNPDFPEIFWNLWPIDL
jgi:hypothetical protein